MKSLAPKEEILRSAIIEIEGTVNSRPLHYTSTEDVCEPAITPNSFLQLSLTGSVPPESPENLNTRQRWAIVQEIAHRFWKKWLKDYLPKISIRRKWLDETKPMEADQIVLIVDPAHGGSNP
jgi:hypothetical protein